MGLKVESVEKNFIGKKAVDKISFSIDKPGVFGLLGTNGAGKTTTIRMLLGIITKDKGEITWNSHNVTRKNVNFGYMPEERGLYPKSKIYDQLMYFAELKGMKKSEAQENIKKWVKKLEIEEYINMPAEKLSKGNQQKVQFAMAVMHEPELIVLDEPFSGLDPVNTELLKNIILELVKEGKYIIMSSHQMVSIEEFCTDILILNRGKTILKGNLKQIKESYQDKTVEVIVDRNIDAQIQEVGLKIYNNVDNHYVLEIKDQSAPSKLLNKLVEEQVAITKFEIKKPSLNDIFVEKVGEVK